MVWRKDLDPAIKAKIRAFIFSYGVGDSATAVAQRKVLARLGVGPFKPADDSHLILVREMEATEQLVAARARGDAEGVSKATATLDALRKQKKAAAPDVS
jgi:phosphonate transport system substrate-binding protein